MRNREEEEELGIRSEELGIGEEAISMRDCSCSLFQSVLLYSNEPKPVSNE